MLVSGAMSWLWTFVYSRGGYYGNVATRGQHRGWGRGRGRGWTRGGQQAVKSELGWTYAGDQAVKAELDAQLDQYMTSTEWADVTVSPVSRWTESRCIRCRPTWLLRYIYICVEALWLNSHRDCDGVTGCRRWNAASLLSGHQRGPVGDFSWRWILFTGLPLFWKPGNVREFCKNEGKGTKSGNLCSQGNLQSNKTC